MGGRQTLMRGCPFEKFEKPQVGAMQLQAAMADGGYAGICACGLPCKRQQRKRVQAEANLPNEFFANIFEKQEHAMMECIRANRPGYDARPQISRVFVDGFYKWLKFFSKDRGKLERAFAHTFNLDAFYAAELDGEIIAIASCASKAARSVSLEKQQFCKHLGFVMGRIAYAALHKEFETKEYPIPMGETTGAIEFVAVASEHQGKGIAGKLIERVIEETGFSEYILEVADTNANAVSLYSRLGFEEVCRVPEKHPKQSGLNDYVYMKKSLK
jgi:ribosomal protein S18 acetylase RimI-like enzyme